MIFVNINLLFVFFTDRFRLVVPHCTELRENLGKEDLGRFMLVGG